MEFDRPMKIDGPSVGKSIIDSLYKRGDEYYFLDVGWTGFNAGHPAHPIGKLVKETDDEMHFEYYNSIRVVSPITEDELFGNEEPMLEKYYEWVAYRDKKSPNADGSKFFKADLGVDVIRLI